MIDFTTVIAIDAHHLEELKLAWSTWEKFKPEIINAPMVIIYDEKEVDPEDEWLDEKMERDNITLIPWNPPEGLYKDQREKMLTSFFQATKFVKTKWYLKIDTDCIANNYDKNWLDESWFVDDPAFVSNPWGYTKPNNTFDIMDDWGDKQELFKGTNRLNLPYRKDSEIVRHTRIISWFYFGLTEWTNEMSKSCLIDGQYKLPFPSQDTFMWYCAERLNKKYVRIKFKKFGLEHWHNIRKIRRRVDEIMKD